MEGVKNMPRPTTKERVEYTYTGARMCYGNNA